MLSVVVRFSALGDLILTSAFTRALEGEVLYVTQDNFKSFVQEYFPNKKLKVFGVKKPKNLLQWFREGQRFGQFLFQLYPSGELRFYDLHNVTKSFVFCLGARLAYFAASRYRLLPELRKSPKFRLRRALLLYLKIPAKYLKNFPVYQRHLSLLEERGTDKNHPELNLMEQTTPFRTGDQKLKVLLAPDAQHWKKIWPKEYWKELIHKLLKVQGLQIELSVVGLNPQIEELEKIYEGTQHKVVDLQGKLDLIDLPRVAAQHHLCVCGNSAWLHISEASNTPVISLAGPIISEFGFDPWRKESLNLERKLWCRPCTLHGDGACLNPNKHECMKTFSPNDVFQKIWQTLGYRSAPQ